jgi:hypothetical protein
MTPKEKGKYYGLLWGHVADIEDPDNLNRVRAYVPAIAEPKTTGWLTPGAWPGAGKDGQGSQYPVQVGGTVGVFFEQGDPHGKGMYLGTSSGLSKTHNTADFPSRLWHRTIGEADKGGQNRTATLWEDSRIAVFADFDEDFDTTETYPRYAQRFTIAHKNTAKGVSLIKLDVAAGENQDTVLIQIKSSNQVNIEAKGELVLIGNPISLNGRRVMPYGKKPI